MKKNPYCHKLLHCNLQKLTLKLKILFVISVLSYTTTTVYASDNTSCIIQNEKEVTVTGNVTDESGLSIPGVTVLVKDSSIGTITDIDGNYVFK